MDSDGRKGTQADSPPGETTVVVLGHVDHGKSTLVGRLLLDTGQVADDRLEFARKRSAEQGREVELAFLLDGLSEEQEQGVTIDFTLVRFLAAGRSFVIADAPGHREFLRNMVSGASRADAALLVVDASEGLREQTRRHAVLLGLLGVTRAVVVVNKMDRVEWSEEAYRELAREVRCLLEGAGVTVSASVPASALHGENVTARPGGRMGWHDGPTVLEALSSLVPGAPQGDALFRMPVQDVYRVGDRRLLAGRVESGAVSAGMEVALWPSGERSSVGALEAWPGPPPALAAAGENAILELSDPLFAERGMVLSAPSLSMVPVRAFDARIFWLGRDGLNVGERHLLRVGHQETGAKVVRFHRVVDPGEIRESRDAPSLPPGFLGEAGIALDRPLVLDTFRSCPAMGRFVLVDGGRVAGGGVVSGLSPGFAREGAGLAAATRAAAIPSPGIGKERRRRGGHPSYCVWITGLPGSGKSTIARRLSSDLLDAGARAHVLDGDVVRAGLCSDLGFSRLDREENVRRVAHAARILVDAGVVAVAALISPFRDSRRKARDLFGPDEFVEVYARCPVGICERRDRKGLYRKARTGELPRFTGVSDVYEEPVSPELVVDTGTLDEEAAARAVADYLAGRGMFPRSPMDRSWSRG